MSGHYLQSLLGDRENIILATRHHWFILASSIVLEIFFNPDHFHSNDCWIYIFSIRFNHLPYYSL